MMLEDLADLFRANSADTNWRIKELNAESYGQLMTMQANLTNVHDGAAGLKGDVAGVKIDRVEVNKRLNLAETVSNMKQQIAAAALE